MSKCEGLMSTLFLLLTEGEWGETNFSSVTEGSRSVSMLPEIARLGEGRRGEGGGGGEAWKGVMYTSTLHSQV